MMTELFGANQLIDFDDFAKLATRLAVNLLFTGLIVHGVYNRLYRNREYVFTYYLFNVITFCLCLLLRKVPIEIGFALGLFAVFGVLRYRTEAIRLRDLTYLFIVIGIGILNALANKKISVAELLAVNVIIAGMTAGLELWPERRGRASTPMLYDRLDLLRPGNRAELIRDLRERTGLAVVRVDVQKIDLLRDAAELTIHYETSGGAA